ncbi:MAG: methyltransferase [Rhizobiaceae bacterium]
MMDRGLHTSVDGFLNNSFDVIQPLEGAHRSGLDALLLAAAIPEQATGRLADFGAGCGVAGMAVAQRCQAVSVDLIEIEPSLVELASQTLALPKNQHFASRIKLLGADISLTGERRLASGLGENQYDHMIANPPYNPGSHQQSPNKSRAQSHVMEEGLLLAWIKTAAVVAKPKATITLILRTESLSEILSTFGNRFGSVRILPIHPTAKAPSNRIIVSAISTGKAALKILPQLNIHEVDGTFTKEAEAIFRGHAGLSF